MEALDSLCSVWLELKDNTWRLSGINICHGLFGRAPMIAIRGVSNCVRVGAPIPETAQVAKIKRPETPETASPAVEGPNKTKIESEDTDTRHPCATAGPKQTRGGHVDIWNRGRENS